MKYTDAMLTEMHEIGSFTYESAKEFADSHEGLTFRSVIAKIRAMELDYQPKDPKVKTTAKPKGRVKSDIVEQIVRHVGHNMPSLSKMTIVDLEALERAVARIEA